MSARAAIVGETWTTQLQGALLSRLPGVTHDSDRGTTDGGLSWLQQLRLILV